MNSQIDANFPEKQDAIELEPVSDIKGKNQNLVVNLYFPFLKVFYVTVPSIEIDCVLFEL